MEPENDWLSFDMIMPERGKIIWAAYPTKKYLVIGNSNRWTIIPARVCPHTDHVICLYDSKKIIPTHWKLITFPKPPDK